MIRENRFQTWQRMTSRCQREGGDDMVPPDVVSLGCALPGALKIPDFPWKDGTEFTVKDLDLHIGILA